MTDFVVAGTGSRSLRVADRAVQVEAMERCTAALEDREAVHGDRLVAMSGFAEGWDEVIARCAIQLRIRLWLAIPNRGYLGFYWGRESLLQRDRLAEAHAILDQAEKVTYVMEEIHHARGLYLNGVHSNFVRNDFMVTGDGGEFTGADDFLVWDPTSKGTAHCLAGIRKAGKPYKILSPEPATLPIM